MRITHVQFELVELPAQPTFRWRQGLTGSEPSTTGGVLRILTDEGVTGVARTRRGVVMADLVDRSIRAELVGMDPLARERLWARLWDLDRREQSFPVYAVGLVDVALWDLAARAAGLPLHQLLGSARDRVPAYASTVTYSSVEEYLDVVDQCLAAGFRAIKVHAWGDARADAQMCQKLRVHVGDDVPLMYDGSAGFDLADAVYLGRALADAGFDWYEEPMREHSITAYRRLAEAVDVPLLVAETSAGAHMNAGDFIVSGCAARVRTSPHIKGGITGAMRIAHLADAFQVRAEVHGSGPVQRHLAVAISNNTYYESLVMGNPVRIDRAIGSDGFVEPPHGPGIGYVSEEQ